MKIDSQGSGIIPGPFLCFLKALFLEFADSQMKDNTLIHSGNPGLQERIETLCQFLDNHSSSPGEIRLMEFFRKRQFVGKTAFLKKV
ncbi:hypothetical protein D3H55_17745 [Bacillus salacetis]|uniref:Uncharacterized protein n=1 Tax=Bacillus salacetis TaxID=2315464 RepID=A0A3A1QRM1_9BACI|nr:hypothetical protein D3H55_17745 [Bacillus salacetis]